MGIGWSTLLSNIPNSPLNSVPVPSAHSEGGKLSLYKPSISSLDATRFDNSRISDLIILTAFPCSLEIEDSNPPAISHFFAIRCPNDPAPWTKTIANPRSAIFDIALARFSILPSSKVFILPLSVINPPPSLITILGGILWQGPNSHILIFSKNCTQF